MSCPRENEATAYVFERSKPDYDAHLADCTECQEAVADAAETVDAVLPVMEPEPETVAEPKSKVPNWPLYLAIGLAAAVVLLNFAFPMTAAETPPPVAPQALDLAWNDPLDTTLSELDAEFDAELEELHLEAL
ncbi:MAG: hypothetical protein GY913_02105 [Proteobacteria bacterium]|nr:hypothetical protein [Pseudomonadota bacterium]MCP4915692.1 hypothetical protein [Pseudomonadota bacterium]